MYIAYVYRLRVRFKWFVRTNKLVLTLTHEIWNQQAEDFNLVFGVQVSFNIKLCRRQQSATMWHCTFSQLVSSVRNYRLIQMVVIRSQAVLWQLSLLVGLKTNGQPFLSEMDWIEVPAHFNWGNCTCTSIYLPVTKKNQSYNIWREGFIWVTHLSFTASSMFLLVLNSRRLTGYFSGKVRWYWREVRFIYYMLSPTIDNLKLHAQHKLPPSELCCTANPDFSIASLGSFIEWYYDLFITKSTAAWNSTPNRAYWRWIKRSESGTWFWCKTVVFGRDLDWLAHSDNSIRATSLCCYPFSVCTTVGLSLLI